MAQLASGGQRETCRNNSSFSSTGPKDGTQVVRLLKGKASTFLLPAAFIGRNLM